MTEWQPIETAPKDGRSVLLVNKDDLLHSVAMWDGRNWQVLGDGQFAVRYMSDFGTEYLTHDYPTHWMPLPNPPAPAETPKGQTDTVKGTDQ